MPKDEVGRQLFFPQYQTKEQTKNALLEVIHQPPEHFGHSQSRWTLGKLLISCDWLRLTSLGGLSQLLGRIGISCKRGRAYIHSPDLLYADKVAYIQHCLEQVSASPASLVFLYLDEFGYERQPSIASDYEQTGHVYPLARRSLRSNTQQRGLGALNALTGQVTYCQHPHITVKHLADFYQLLVQVYADAQTIYVVQDNWPLHAHPDVLRCLQAQHSPFRCFTPENWPTLATKPYRHDLLPVQLLFLPTYAPWLNPIEKLWRLVRQQLIHLHRFSDNWPTLKQRVLDFIAQFQAPSTYLLRYVGLLPY